MEDHMLTCSCACGAVTYAVDADLSQIIHCHCQTCRKVHAAAFSSISAVPRDKFRWTSGEDRLTTFESSPGKFRRFCSMCESHLIADRKSGPTVTLRLGCLDTEVKGQALAHIWRSDAAPWFDPKERLEEYAEGHRPA